MLGMHASTCTSAVVHSATGTGSWPVKMPNSCALHHAGPGRSASLPTSDRCPPSRGGPGGSKTPGTTAAFGVVGTGPPSALRPSPLAAPARVPSALSLRSSSPSLLRPQATAAAAAAGRQVVPSADSPVGDVAPPADKAAMAAISSVGNSIPFSPSPLPSQQQNRQ